MIALPPLAGDYPLDEGYVCRVTVAKLGPVTINGNVMHDFRGYEAQGWLLDAEGNFVLKPESGDPIRTAGSTHNVSLSGLAAKSIRLDAGWIRYAPPAGTVIDPANLPEDWGTGASLPATANVGDKFYCAGPWQWTAGELDRFRRVKVAELRQILLQRELDAIA